MACVNNADGTLTYSFVESVKSSYPFWFIRFLGGACILGSMFIMAYNVCKTVRGAKVSKAVVPPAAARQLRCLIGENNNGTPRHRTQDWIAHRSLSPSSASAVGRDRPAVLPENLIEPVAGHQTVRAAATGWT